MVRTKTKVMKQKKTIKWSNTAKETTNPTVQCSDQRLFREIKSRSKFSLKIFTKLMPQSSIKRQSWPNFNLTWPKFSFKILHQTSASKSLPNLSFKILTKLSSSRSIASTSATLTTSRSFELAYSKARVTLVRSTKTDEFSEKVQRASDPHPLFSEKRKHKRQSNAKFRCF